MSTRQKQLAANRASALRSIGPRVLKTTPSLPEMPANTASSGNALYRAMKELDRLKHHRLQRRKPRP